MKTLKLLLFVLFLGSSSYCQISLTQSDLPSVGDKSIRLIDSFFHHIAITPPSLVSQHWDYSLALQPNDTQIWEYQPINAAQNANEFGGSNLVIIDHDPYAEVYYTKNSKGLFFNGVFSITGFDTFRMKFNPPDLLTPVPFSLSNTRLDTSVMTLIIPGNNMVKIVSTSSNTLLADAFGSLKIPGKTYTDVLRIRKKSKIHTNIYVFFSNTWNLVQQDDSFSTTYSWYRQGANSSVMDVAFDEDSNIIVASYILNTTTSSDARDDFQLQPVFSINRNPTKGAFEIDFQHELENSAILVIWDSNGRAILSETLIPKVKKYRVSTGHLSPGIYFLRIEVPGTKGFYAQKIIID